MPTTEAVCVTDPDAAILPVHGDPLAPPPLAVHAVAPIDVQVRVNDWPVVTAVEVDLKVSESAAIVSVVCVEAGGVFGSTLSQLRPKV